MDQTPPRPESLQKQLERTRLERALEVSESLAEHRALLTNAELARLNKILIGKPPTDESEPWRQGPVSLTLPSGKTETFNVIADPKVNLRDKLHHATELAEAGNAIEAAVYIYSSMVLSHFFEDANRRTAVLAAHYFLKRYGVPLSALALHEMGLGDLREEGQVEALRETLKNMAKFAARRKS